MVDLGGSLADFFRRLSHSLRPDPLQRALSGSRLRLLRAAQAGRVLDDATIEPILTAIDRAGRKQLSEAEESRFYSAYGELNRRIADVAEDEESAYPFDSAVDDAERLLKYASEIGVQVEAALVDAIVDARDAIKAGDIAKDVRVNFYAAYTKLAAQFGTVTAETIRSCRSRKTRQDLKWLRNLSAVLTASVAFFSVVTFVADASSKKISEQSKGGSDEAAAIRADLFSNKTNIEIISAKYANGDPCKLTATPPEDQDKIVQDIDDISRLQSFSATIRDLHGNAIKLNNIISRIPFSYVECDPFDTCARIGAAEAKPSPDDARRALQISPALLNYTAEALCKIQTFQHIRSFATNVNGNYAIIFGAFAAYALPILYALLGALAYQLRTFSDAIRKKTYYSSFSDTARVITAVIAGAISGLLNPARGLELSPLAVAFLVGYGVEIFFKFLDGIMNAFSPAPAPGPRPMA